jgi:DNA recombination protein RmuC
VVTTFLSVIVLLLVATLGALLVVLRRLAAARVDLSPLAVRIESVERAQERAERGLREEIARGRQDVGETLTRANDSVVKQLEVFGAFTREQAAAMERQVGAFRAENADGTKKLNDSLVQTLAAMATSQSAELSRMAELTGQRLGALQEENTAKLEQIRRTVDEQLQTALEKRLGDSFRIVSDRLEQVHRGLGEMQTLASGVGDLKKLLTNVRTRGTWGEAQLGMLLEQMLTAEQYALNVACTGTAERVEFAIKLPGPDRDGHIWLPIDAKFPREDYERLLDAVERADAAAVEASSRDLELRIRQCARDIAQKYIAPPATTEFAILYLPTEGLYAEVLRRPGLIEGLQREHHVTIAGPMTLAAILNSLQMGFRTLAIQKRSSEVWEVLGQVKTEFEKYADLLVKVQKKLQEASNTVDLGLTRTRVLHRKLKGVQELPGPDAGHLSVAAEFEAFELESLAAAPELSS